MLHTMNALYVVGTPIGNLEDITLRALRILKEADVVLCEDTRVTKKLLAHFAIHTPTLSFHAHSGGAKVEKVLGLLGEGKSCALVTDAGTPGISDPGAALVSAVREAGFAVVAIPGASALSVALSVSGLSVSDLPAPRRARQAGFLFLGFLPHKKGRQTLFKEIAESKHTVVFFESPHRVLKTLSALAENLTIDRKVVIARELTKIHESVYAATADEHVRHFADHPDELRGEFVFLIEPAR